MSPVKKSSDSDVLLSTSTGRAVWLVANAGKITGTVVLIGVIIALGLMIQWYATHVMLPDRERAIAREDKYVSELSSLTSQVSELVKETRGNTLTQRDLIRTLKERVVIDAKHDRSIEENGRKLDELIAGQDRLTRAVLSEPVVRTKPME